MSTKIKPFSIDEGFGIGCAEENLHHLTIEPVFKPYIQQVVDLSKKMGNHINWLDANLQDAVVAVMRDKDGNEIDADCTEMTFRVEERNISVVIEDQIGQKAMFHLGDAESLWPGCLTVQDQPCDGPANEKAPRVLIMVKGGIADFVSDPGLDIEVFDFDNYEDDPEGTTRPPAHFADMAEPMGIPLSLHRCGYCGTPTDKDGNPLQEVPECDGWDEAWQTHGACCVGENPQRQAFVTKEMAIDAGDPSLEGHPL